MSTDEIDGDVYSKFVHKNWTFDANVSGKWQHHDKDDLTSRQVFKDIMFDNKHYDEVIRNSISENGCLKRSDFQWISLRATYRNDSRVIQHSVSFNRNAMPVLKSSSMLIFHQMCSLFLRRWNMRVILINRHINFILFQELTVL